MYRWRKTAILLRAALLIGLSVVAAVSVPLLMGLGIGPFRSLFSPEIGLFTLLFASSALVFTLGSVIAAKGRGYILFTLAALIIIILPIHTLSSETEKSRPIIHKIPQSFHGTVVIHYGESDYPPIPKIKGYEVIRISESGSYRTSSPRPPRGIRHVLVDEKGNEIQPISIPGETFKLGITPDIKISEYEVP